MSPAPTANIPSKPLKYRSNNVYASPTSRTANMECAHLRPSSSRRRYAAFEREAIIKRLVDDPYGHGHQDRIPVSIAGINDRSMTDDYFLTLYDLQVHARSTNDEEASDNQVMNLKLISYPRMELLTPKPPTEIMKCDWPSSKLTIFFPMATIRSRN